MLHDVTIVDQRTLHNLWMLQMVQYDKVSRYIVYKAANVLLRLHSINLTFSSVSFLNEQLPRQEA